MKIVLAGGGTGGHVFPGLAIARALVARGAEPHFVGAQRGMEIRVVPAAGFPLELLDLEPMVGGGLLRALRGGMIASAGVASAVQILRRLRPGAVLGVGGYAAGPTCLAAKLLRIPMAVLEPNAVLGFTNRMLAPLATRAYVASAKASASFRRARWLGVPVREGFLASPYPAEQAPLRIVVLGGSQGAKALNTQLPAIFAQQIANGHSLSVLHQTGQSQVEETQARYDALGAPAEVRAFIDDVQGAFSQAHLVLARAGASTVAEILAAARPSVLVPYPHAAADHQRENALEIERAGAAVCVTEPDLAKRLPEVLGSLLASRAEREAMSAAARDIAKPHAAADIAADLLALAAR